MPSSSRKAATKKTPKSNAGKTGFGAGDYVINPLKPDWGPGKVVELKRNVVFVYFRDRPGKEVIRMKQEGLRPAEVDAELEALPAFVEKGEGFGLPATRKRAAKKKAE